MSLGEYVDFPGNLIIAVGEYDEMISTEDAIEAIRAATGNASAEPGVTYGSLATQTAYKLSFAPTDHVFEALDQTIVGETVSWLIEGVQGEGHLAHTLDPMNQIFFTKTIGMAGGVLFLFISTMPFMAIVYSFLPENLKPRKIPLESKPFSIQRTFVYGSILGAILVGVYTLTSATGFHLENLNLIFPNSMFATGLNLFYILSAVSLAAVMFIMMGRQGFTNALASVGVGMSNPKDKLIDMLKGLFLAAITIIWMMGWLALCGLPEMMEPWIALALVKWPVWERGINTLIVAIISVPYLIIDAAMIRGLLLSDRQWNGSRVNIKSMILAFASKFGVTAILAVVVVFGTTALGFISGKMVLLGLLLLLFLIVDILVTVTTLWTATDLRNTWPAIFLGAFLLAIVAVSSIPLI
jgi:hypothetical protein